MGQCRSWVRWGRLTKARPVRRGYVNARPAKSCRHIYVASVGRDYFVVLSFVTRATIEVALFCENISE